MSKEISCWLIDSYHYDLQHQEKASMQAAVALVLQLLFQQEAIKQLKTAKENALNVRKEKRKLRAAASKIWQQSQDHLLLVDESNGHLNVSCSKSSSHGAGSKGTWWLLCTFLMCSPICLPQQSVLSPHCPKAMSLHIQLCLDTSLRRALSSQSGEGVQAKGDTKHSILRRLHWPLKPWMGGWLSTPFPFLC